MDYLPTLIDFTLRLAFALFLGGIIGIEREYRSKDAGFRTHFLVALGSALFCIVSQHGFGADLKDSSRVAAQVVSGIGFLGAGIIIFQKNVVRGLTTAAGMWVTAAIGLACGAGMFALAAIATILILLGLEVIHALIPQVGSTNIILQFTAKSKEEVRLLMERIKSEGIEVSAYELQNRRRDGHNNYEIHLELRAKRGYHSERLLNYMHTFDEVMLSSNE